MSEQTEIQSREDDGNSGWRGAEQLRPYLCRISLLRPTAGNPDKGKAHVGRLKASLTRFGQTKPITIDSADGETIRAGHHLTRAAEELGWTHIAGILADFSDEGEAIAYSLADNRLARVGDEDVNVQQQLALLNLVGDKLQGTGWDVDSVEKMRLESGVEPLVPAAEAEPWEGPAAETAEEGAARSRATKSYTKVPIDLTQEEHEEYEEYIQLLKQAYGVRSAKDVILAALQEAYERKAAPVPATDEEITAADARVRADADAAGAEYIIEDGAGHAVGFGPITDLDPPAETDLPL